MTKYKTSFTILFEGWQHTTSYEWHSFDAARRELNSVVNYYGLDNLVSWSIERIFVDG
jgi:hypothetical protein